MITKDARSRDAVVHDRGLCCSRVVWLELKSSGIFEFPHLK